jgi:hypothetical protein
MPEKLNEGAAEMKVLVERATGASAKASKKEKVKYGSGRKMTKGWLISLGGPHQSFYTSFGLVTGRRTTSIDPSAP